MSNGVQYLIFFIFIVKVRPGVSIRENAFKLLALKWLNIS